MFCKEILTCGDQFQILFTHRHAFVVSESRGVGVAKLECNGQCIMQWSLRNLSQSFW